jgi:hypothetical protein
MASLEGYDYQVPGKVGVTFDCNPYLVEFFGKLKTRINLQYQSCISFINESNWFRFIGKYEECDISDLSTLMPEIDTDLVITDWIERFQENAKQLVEFFSWLETYWQVTFTPSHLKIVFHYVTNAIDVLEFFDQRGLLDVQYAKYAAHVSVDTVKYMYEHGFDINEMAKSCMTWHDDEGFDSNMTKLFYFANNGVDLSGLIKEIKQDYLSGKIKSKVRWFTKC